MESLSLGFLYPSVIFLRIKFKYISKKIRLFKFSLKVLKFLAAAFVC